MDTLLSIKGLKKSYGKKTVLDGVSLILKGGDICGLLGNNGAGKSTLMKIICGLSKPGSGEIKICGKNPKLFPKETKAVLGCMIESPSFYTELTGYQNLLYLAKFAGGIPKDRIKELLNIAGLSEHMKKRTEKYSAGMQQRLYFVKALMNYPKILILDEPFNAIDPSARKIMKELIIAHAAGGGAVLISGHSLPDIQSICNCVYILDKHKIAYESREIADSDLESIFLSVAESGGQAQ